MLIANDVHFGFRRAGGTTPLSQEAARTYLFSSFVSLLANTAETHLLLQGDLFDDFTVELRDWLMAFQILDDWCSSGKMVTLVAGNHDHSARADKVSSFQALCDVLKSAHPISVNIIAIDEWHRVEPGVVALAHCSNQDVFDMKLKEVLEVPLDQFPSWLLLHANYHNNFAACSDHSLNVSEDVAREFTQRGCKLVFAHEHQARTAINGKVICLGNQWPTSIADCLGNDEKFAHILKDNVLSVVCTWARDTEFGYEEVNWRDLDKREPIMAFVKVVGEATAREGAEVINAISKLRQRSKAFVISNGVSIDGIVQSDTLPEQFEAAKAFDVMSFMKKQLDPEEFALAERLNKEER